MWLCKGKIYKCNQRNIIDITKSPLQIGFEKIKIICGIHLYAGIHEIKWKRGKIEIFAIDNMNNYEKCLISILFHSGPMPFWSFQGFDSYNFLIMLTFGFCQTEYKFLGFFVGERKFAPSQRESLVLMYNIYLLFKPSLEVFHQCLLITCIWLLYPSASCRVFLLFGSFLVLGHIFHWL